MNYGRALRIGRAARNLSQQELAQRVGVKPSYISMLERGERKNPAYSVLARCAAALDIPNTCFALLASTSEERKAFDESDLDFMSKTLIKDLLR